MNIQKAMRVRAELKKASANLDSVVRRCSKVVAYEEEKPTDEELEKYRNSKINALDGMSYLEAVKKKFAYTEAIYNLNMAIEKTNQKGHELLFKESELKSKMAIIDRLIADSREVVPEEEVEITDYENADVKGNYKKVKVTRYSYSLLRNDALGLPLNDLRKSINKELEDVRDELAAFNSTAIVDYEVPEGLL